MSTIRDYHNTGDDSNLAIDDTRWLAQSFTAASTYVIKSVKLKLWRDPSIAPGTITVSLRIAGNGDYKPYYGDIVSGTTNGDTLPTTEGAAEWREITFTSDYLVKTGDKLAIVVGCSVASDPLKLREGSTYAGGLMSFSDDSGSTWTADSAKDLMFEIYGDDGYILKQNNYDGGLNNGYTVIDSTSEYEGAIFMADSDYNLVAVSLWVWKYNYSGTPGTLTVAIRATSGGLPTGSNLATSSINATNVFGAYSYGQGYNFILSTPVALTNGETYAIIIYADAVSGSSDAIRFGRDGLAGGSYVSSSDSGSSWSKTDNIIYPCITFREPDYEDIAASGGGTSGGSANLRVITYEDIAAEGGGTSGGTAVLDSYTPVEITAEGGGTSGGTAILGKIYQLIATGGGTSKCVGVLRRQRYYRIQRKILLICNNKVYYENR